MGHHEESASPAPRFTAEIPVGCSGGRLEGFGTVVDVSASGARVGAVSTPMPNGTKVHLEFGLLSDLESFSVWAEVVRQTDDGFAVRFLTDDPNVEKLLIPLLHLLEARAGLGHSGGAS